MFQRRIIWYCFLISVFLTGSVVTVSGQSANAPQTRSIRDWARCDGKTDDDAAVAKAFDAAKNGAFTLVVDCPVFIHIGTDVRHPIFIDNGTKVQFTKAGQFTIDNVFVPAFVIANSSSIQLLGWHILYKGGLPADPNVGGYYDNGVFIQRPTGYAQPAFIFNDAVLSPWLTVHKGIHFTATSSPWLGPTNTSSVFFIIGSTHDVVIQDFSISVPPNAKDSQFIPMVFSSAVGFNSNQTVTRQTPLTSQYCSAPGNFTFSNVTLDGYYMGWQGRFHDTTIQHVRAYRYGDLEDANGGTVGGVNKWFAPPHLFYLNYDPKSGIINKNIQIRDVIDYGQRIGVARDIGTPASGYANSLKIGVVGGVVDGYKSYRPDGFLDLLTSSNLRISNVDVTYDSSFLNDLYPGIRFPQPPYQNVIFENFAVTDKARSTKVEPIASSSSAANSGIVMRNIKVSINDWAKPAPAAPRVAASNVRAVANVSAKPALTTLCPHLAGTGHSVDIQYSVHGSVQRCTQP